MGRNLFHRATDMLGGHSGGRVPAPTARLQDVWAPSTASAAARRSLTTPCTWGGDEFVSPRPGRGRRLGDRCPHAEHAPWAAHIPVVTLMRGGTSQQDARYTADEQTRSAMAAGTLPNVAVGACGCVLDAPHGSVLDCRFGMR